ncbi:MAG: winged helix DNA-binding domain-containing protein [Sandaracinaceae bacterium]|nr:winged helix DNA-binding domain-containing protein [Sandaracinaceae bacterium]
MVEIPLERARLLARRLAAQQLTARASSVAEAARRMLGVQAQDLTQAYWALGARSVGTTEQIVRATLATGAVVRTWCMRGTLHAVAVEDAGWLVRLLAPRNLARAARRRRELEIDERDVRRARTVAERHLADGGLSRAALFARFEEAGQAVRAQRGTQLLFCLSQEGVLHQVGDLFVPAPAGEGRAGAPVGDEALFELARRYRLGHGPCTATDLAFWAGIGKREAQRALERAELEELDELASPPPPPRAILLPGYDEYLLGYADRDACIDRRHAARVVPGGNGIYQPMVVLDGVIRGTWRRVEDGSGQRIHVQPFVSMGRWRAELERAAQAYAEFTGLPTELRIELPSGKTR